MKKELAAFEKILGIMDELREKCPWDNKQTLESLSILTIEEVYELADAILNKNMEGIKEELGDILLHIIFYAKIGSETNDFNITDVIESISSKLISRHPHVFGSVHVKDDTEVKDNWEKIKIKEGKESVLSGVPKTLPALVKAYRIQDKARGVGFDWEEKNQVWDKVAEEMGELKSEMEAGNQEKIKEEFGDLFFSLINAARLYNIDPENALEMTNKKFIKRFSYLEKEAYKAGKILSEMSLKEMDEIWERAKKI